MNAIVRPGILGVSVVCLTLVASGMAAEPSKRPIQDGELRGATPPEVGPRVNSPSTAIGWRRADDLRRSRPSLTWAVPGAVDEELESPAEDRTVTTTFEEVEILLDRTVGLDEIRALPQAPGSTFQELTDPARIVVQMPTEVVARLAKQGATVRTLRRFVLIEGASDGPQDRTENTQTGICTGDYCYGQNWTNVVIPDYDGWVSSPITISCADPSATVICIDVHYEILHPYRGNLDVDLNDADLTYNYDLYGPDRYDPGVDLNETVTGITTFNGEAVNQTWFLWVRDTAYVDEGLIDEWWIKVYFSGGGQPCCDPPYSPGDRIQDLASGVCGTVVCCDFDDPVLPVLASWDGQTGLGGCEQCPPCDNGNCCQHPEGSYAWRPCDAIALGCSFCGDGVCNPDETTHNCPQDCCDPVCGDGMCQCECGEAIFDCPGDCLDVPCDAAPLFQVCTNDYGELCAATVLLCPCEPQCDNCWQGDCELWRDGDGPCDCRCQFCDQDCPEYPGCCIPGPEPGYAYTAVFPLACGSTDPPDGWSVWDPDAGAYLFCSTYTVGTCQGDVCLRFWIDWEGLCDPELWWHFDQNDPQYCECVDSCGNGVCEPDCGENCDTCRLDCLPGSVVWSDPPKCAIDARQPSKPDCTEPCGWNSIDIMFDDDAFCLTETDFAVRLVPDDGVPPRITEVRWRGSMATLVLDSRIPPGCWTCFEYLRSQSPWELCLGRLPADVSGDRTSAPADILWLIDRLNGVRSCEYWQCDVDCSALCGPPDILRVIDLLNGAGCYDPWLNRSLEPCPSGP